MEESIRQARRHATVLALVAAFLCAAAVAPPGAKAAPRECSAAEQLLLKVDERGAFECAYSPRGLHTITENCDNPAFRRDAEGIPMVNYDGTYRYNPATAAMCGLNEFNYFLVTGDANRLAYAERVAAWLVRRQDRTSGAWLYDFDFDLQAVGTTLRAPWPSALAQGLAISLLVRVYTVTGEPAYLGSAKLAARPFTVDAQQGGVVSYLDGHPFYEGLPTNPPNFALEDLATSLIGLYDLKEAEDERTTRSRRPPLAERLFDRGIRTLRATVALFDVPGKGSVYFLGPYAHSPLKETLLAGPEGTARNAFLLRTLHSVTSTPRFLVYANRWTAIDA